MPAWNPFGLLGLAAMIVAWGLAAIVYFTLPTRKVNRRLALVMALEGMAVGSGFGLVFLAEGASAAYAWQHVQGVATIALPAAYLGFLATLDSPLAHPLRHRAAGPLLITATAAAETVFLAFPLAFLERMEPSPLTGWLPMYLPPADLVGLANLLVFLFGLLVAASMARRSRVTSALRPRARAYLLAFGTRDAAYAVLFASFFFLARTDPLAVAAWSTMLTVISVVFVALLAYGALRVQLLDLDLRVKRGLGSATFGAVFLGAFAVVTGTASLLAPVEAALILGAAVAVALAPARGRVRGWADRVAAAAMPGVPASPAESVERRLEVYRAALEEGRAEDGRIPPRDDPALRSLRAHLGLTERDHAVLDFALRRMGGAPRRSRPMPAGTLVLGRYRVQRTLGEGSNGSAYLAHDTALSRPVVVKALHPQRAQDAEVLREARAIGAVRHGNVVTVYDVEVAGDEVFIVMEHLGGGSLAERIARGPLRPGEFRGIATGLLRALEAVHAAGVVHRDVKPSNVLLTIEGEAKLADFGVAHVPGVETTVGGGQAVGTVRFMSPEQARGKRVTERSDLFSAAATLYEAFAGEPYLRPLPGESAVEVQMRAARAVPFDREVEPVALRRWFARALHPLPERRFAGARAMREALERALAERATRARGG